MPVTKEQCEAITALGSRIKELREERKLTQAKLADIMGRDRQSLWRLEKGYVNPGYIFLLELCEALDVNPIDFFKGMPDKSKKLCDRKQ